MKGSNWANVDIPSARETLKEFVLGEKPPTDKLEKAVQNRYSFDKISKGYDSFWKRWK